MHAMVGMFEEEQVAKGNGDDGVVQGMWCTVIVNCVLLLSCVGQVDLCWTTIRHCTHDMWRPRVDRRVMTGETGANNMWRHSNAPINQQPVIIIFLSSQPLLAVKHSYKFNYSTNQPNDPLCSCVHVLMIFPPNRSTTNWLNRVPRVSEINQKITIFHGFQLNSSNATILNHETVSTGQHGWLVE